MGFRKDDEELCKEGGKLSQNVLNHLTEYLAKRAKEGDELSKEDGTNRFTEYVAKRAKDCGLEQEYEEMAQEMKKVAATTQSSEDIEIFHKAVDGAMDRLKAKEMDEGVVL